MRAAGAEGAPPGPSSAWQLPDHPSLVGKEQECSKETNDWCLCPTQRKRIRAHIFSSYPVIWPGVLGIWAFLAWPELDPRARGGQRSWGGGEHFEWWGWLFQLWLLTGRLRQWNWACAHCHQAGTRCHREHGNGDRCPWCELTVPLEWGKKGCCIS